MQTLYGPQEHPLKLNLIHYSRGVISEQLSGLKYFLLLLKKCLIFPLQIVFLIIADSCIFFGFFFLWELYLGSHSKFIQVPGLDLLVAGSVQ